MIWPEDALREIEVDAPHGATVQALNHALAAHFTCDNHLVLAAQGHQLATDLPLGVAPLVDGACLVLAPESPPSRSPAARSDGRLRPPVVLSVAHGPDAGRSHDLTPGTHRVGRSAEADVVVDDDLLSRLHLEVSCDADGVMVRDLHSTNGARLDSSTLGPKPVPWSWDAVLRIGHTDLGLRPATGVPAACTPQPDGTVLVNRQPRVVLPPADAETVTVPRAPHHGSRSRLPWVAILAPVPIAAVTAVFLGPASLAFGLVSPLLLGGNALAERLHGARRYAAQRVEFESSLAQALARVDTVCGEERRRRHLDTPDPAEILAVAVGHTARLWERRRHDADALAVGVGTCTSRAAVRVVGPPEHLLVEEPPLLSGVPCVVRLREVGVVSICGAPGTVAGAVRSILGQLLTLHSPVDLRVVMLSAAGRADTWQWLSRVPHLRAWGPTAFAADLDQDVALAHAVVDRLARTVAQRRAVGPPPDVGDDAPHILVLLDGAAALRSIPGLSTVLEHGPAVGVSVLALDEVVTALPSETGALIDLTDPGRPALRLPGHEHQGFLVDAVGSWWAERLSRGLAPLRDATPVDEGAFPAEVPLLSLVPGADDASVVADLWQEGRPAAAPVGVTAHGPWVLDLDIDGPHILVAGTTGSGKSELLRTLVTSFAIHHRPELLSFVLVDYKGGAAFGGCGQLPHTVGVVTDLDEHLAHRALTSLRAELKRRERLFATVGARDISSYQRDSSAAEPLPRLVLVIDEFRALADELPEFIDGIVSIAALGRSLGLHVVLATQRPAGVVTADIKANVNLRIALRVREVTDSHDVLAGPEAAAIDPATPGRGYARSGGSGLVGFHAAHLSAPGRPTGIRVRDLVWARTQPPWPSPDIDDSLERIVSAVGKAAAMVGSAPGPPVWLPPLPPLIPLTALPAPTRAQACAIGLVDRPELHAQVPLELDLAASGHWAFLGAAGSGRTTALLAVAGALARRLRPDELHLYAVSNGTLAGLADLPHCGAHVDLADHGRLERLVDRLEAELRSRQRERSPACAWLLLVVDDWDVLAGHPTSLEHARLVDRLLALLRDGESQGLMAVVAGDRSLLLGRLASATARRVVLRLADRTDAALAGIATSALPRDPPPGRGVLADGAEVQLAIGPAGTVSTQTLTPGRGPSRLEPLPVRVLEHDLPTPAPGATPPVGLGGDDLTPLGLDEERDGRRWLVAGAPGSGVSQTLLLVARRLLTVQRPLAIVAPRAGPLDVLRDDRRLVRWLDGHSTTPRDLPAEGADLTIIVDCADELVDTTADDLLRAHARRVERSGGLLVVGACSTALSTQYRGVAVEVARDRTGILLGPRSRLESDLFGLRLRADPQAPPGRGYLIRRGQAVALQVALSTTRPDGDCSD